MVADEVVGGGARRGRVEARGGLTMDGDGVRVGPRGAVRSGAGVGQTECRARWPLRWTRPQKAELAEVGGPVVSAPGLGGGRSVCLSASAPQPKSNFSNAPQLGGREIKKKKLGGRVRPFWRQCT